MIRTRALLLLAPWACALNVLYGCATSVPLNSQPVPPPVAMVAPHRVPPPTAPLPPVANPGRGPDSLDHKALPVSFLPPARGAAVTRFDGQGNKGVDIALRAGDPVFAARDGRVVLVSSALPAYGTMIVIKHDDDFITAYAHLGKTLVQENASVRQGQPIAEMGPADSSQVALHFEIRKLGVPVDPQVYVRDIPH